MFDTVQKGAVSSAGYQFCVTTKGVSARRILTTKNSLVDQERVGGSILEYLRDLRLS